MSKLNLVAVMLFLTVAAYAQENEGGSWKDRGNYYVELTGGANYNASENLPKGPFGKTIGYGGEVAVGYVFTPYWSADVQLGFNENKYMHGNKFDPNNYNNFLSPEIYVNGAFNLLNGLGGFKEGRKNNLYLVAGIGAAYSCGYGKGYTTNEVSFGVRVGLSYNYSFNENWAIVAKVTGNGFTDKFNSIEGGIGMDGRVDARVGVRFSWGKNLSRWTPEPKIEYVDRVEYVDKVVTKLDTVTVVEQVYAEETIPTEKIFFKINSSDIQKHEMSKIVKLADYLKAHPEKALLVTGSADSQTGTERVNQRLRVNRARSIAKVLTDEFGIEKNRIKTIVGKGISEDIYLNEYEKNRCSICVVFDL